MSRIDESKEFIPVRIAVLTVSDTRSLDDDRSGDTLVQRITDEGTTYLTELRRSSNWSRLLVHYFGDDAPAILGREPVS